MVLFASMFLLCSCECKHKELSEANCTTPPICLKCNEGIGSPLGHTDGEWITDKEPTCTEDGSKHQICSVCSATIKTETLTKLGHTEVTDAAITPTCTTDGKTEGKHCSVCNAVLVAQIVVNKLGHTEVTDAAIAPTCTADGKTEGKHCSVCNAVLVAQTVVNKLGHTEVTDAAIAPTCTTDGKTEGKHCGVCNTVLIAQNSIPATGHNCTNISILSEATCIQSGLKQFSCVNCSYSYTESFELPSYTATEINNQALKYVGEITTYDKNGTPISMATGFVYSSDGKIITNYHVIDGAYYANIVIDGTTYQIQQVLAYDSKIDLAVLKVNGTFSNYANICKNAIAVGSRIYAIGSSRGLTNTFSQGIVTYYNRIVDGVSHIQHDASITNGNSGGPLINEYGEVVGINTWLLTDSQNLNFAVFTTELDNLTYGSPLSLEEFYLKECNVFERLKDYIIDNGTYSSSGNYYYLTLGITYSNDYSSKYTRKAYYYVADNDITLDLLINDGEYWTYFTIDENVDGSYYWKYFDDNDYAMSGTLYASTYDSDTLLGYSSNNIYSSSMRQSIRELASVMISILCLHIDDDFATINVTAEDLGFYYY